MKQVFVFVVCGAKEHIDTLNFSLPYLRLFSKKDIWIVTESKRNEEKINHTDVIEFETPAHLNNHQASIFLKTGLHKILPAGNRYCYLDTDVIALNENVDEIFKAFLPPIMFAPDHCRLSEFSHSATNCDCLYNYNLGRERIFELERQISKKYDKNFNVTNLAGQQELLARINRIKKEPLLKVWDTIRYYLSGDKFKLGEYTYHKTDKYWTDNQNEIVLYDFDEMVRTLMHAEQQELREVIEKKYVNSKGPDCNHLQQQILKDFSINVENSDWQHWNGGVFLFGEESYEFLDAWHQKCLFVFESPEWKTRDQGTLIATVWEFGLQNHPTLSKKWNFLADVNNTQLTFDNATGKISDNGGETYYQPSLIHIYHDFGKNGWPVWDWVVKLFASYN